MSRQAFQFIARLRASLPPNSSDRQLYLLNAAHMRLDQLPSFHQRFQDLKDTVTNPNTDPAVGDVYLGDNHWTFCLQWTKQDALATVNDIWLLPNGDALGNAINLLLDNSNYIKLKSYLVDEQQDLVVPWPYVPDENPSGPLVAMVRFDTPPELYDLPDQALGMLVKTAKRGGWSLLAQGIYFTGFPGRWLLVWSVPDEASLNVVQGIFNQQYFGWNLNFDFGTRVIIP